MVVMSKKRVIKSRLNKRLVKPKYSSLYGHLPFFGNFSAEVKALFNASFSDFRNLPLSMRVLTTYIALIGAVYLLFGYYSTSVLLGAVLKGSLAKILNLSLFAIVCFVIYGILKRKYWGWQLSVSWFFFEILNSLISTLFSKKEEIFASYISTGTAYIAVLNAIIIWFLVKKKNYFTGKILSNKLSNKSMAGKKSEKSALMQLEPADKVFLFSFSILVVLMLILASSSITTIYLETTYLSKQIVGQIDQKSLDQAIFLCNDKFGQQKDVCYVVLAVAYGDEIKSEQGSQLCDNIAFSFYKITCLRALG